MVCPHGQAGRDLIQCGQGGSIFIDFMQMSFMHGPNPYGRKQTYDFGLTESTDYYGRISVTKFLFEFPA